jgi:hypothetical protein
MDLVEKAKKHWFVGIISIAVLCIGITWVVAVEILVKPRDFIIEQKEKKITELEKVITGHEKEKKSLEDKLDLCREKLARCSNGRIILPREGEVVPMEFSFEVEINAYNPKKRYYLVNEVNEQYWPKIEINPTTNGRKIVGQIVEAGNPPGGIFHLVLIEVNVQEDQELRNYFKGETHPGIQRIGNVLHRIQLKVIK